MSFYEDFIEEGHACYGCLEFFTDKIDAQGISHGVGFPRLCTRCERAQEDKRVDRNERQNKADQRAYQHRQKKPRR